MYMCERFVLPPRPPLTVSALPLPFSLSSPLSLSCFLQPACFLIVEGDFKLALKEDDEKFSDELKDDCEVRGDGGE